MAEERLQKIVSFAGAASRRKAERMIVEGRITVNGAVVTELGSKADLERDHIKVDGKRLHAPRNLVYLALYKPNNCMTTMDDPEGRATVMDLLRGLKERVYPVGRLDYHSEGLLLLTNDGELANAITTAANHIPKVYLVKVTGMLSPDQEEAFRNGILLEGRRTAPAGLKLLHRAQNPWYEVRLIEGRKNQIRMMFKYSGKLVEKLKRVKIGPLEVGSLKPGEFRHLAPGEIEKLKRIVASKPSARTGKAPSKRPTQSPAAARARRPGKTRSE
ncbi:MAG: pseudouridine synthase [Bryobacteraceae bacterium]